MNSERENKPTFNVVPSFCGAVTVQLNSLMSDKFLSYLRAFDDIDEPDLLGLIDSLEQGVGGYSDETEDYGSFTVVSFDDVVVIVMNHVFKDALISLIDEDSNHVDVEIHALMKGLRDPVRCMQHRFEKKREYASRNHGGHSGPRRRRVSN